MHFRSIALCTVSLAALCLPTASYAQTTAATAAAPAEDPPADDAIVVTGIRASLRSAQAIKRSAPQVIDAIVAEDIGKLPDVAVSDTAARIPGVQVERSGGEASRVLVRGLPDFSTTYNGREIFTAETRLVALQDFPSGGIGAIEVFKTSSADLVEPGLAGLVNVRSRRPFDFNGFELAGSLWGIYTKQSREFQPNGNLLITNRWDTGAGEIGALLSVSYTRLHYLDSTRENTDFVADPVINGQRVRFPDIQRIFYGEATRTRPSINGALQWRPEPGLEFYVEGLWQGFRNEVEDRLFAAPLWGGQSYSNIVLRPGTNLVQSGTVVNPFRPDGFQGGTFNKTNTYQFAFGGSYDGGSLNLKWDIARTDSTFTGSTASVDYALSGPQTIDFNLNVPTGDGGAEFILRNFDAANPANYIYRGFYEEAQVAKGKDLQARLDLEYDTGMAFLPTIQAGVRYVNRDAHREFGNRYWNFEGRRLPFSAVPLDYQLNSPGFRGSNTQAFRSWLTPTYRSIRSNLVKLREFNMALGGTAFGPNTNTTVAANPQETYDANEKTYAGYGQIKYEFGSPDGVQVDGQIGVRVVKTDLNVAGTSRVEQTPGNFVLTPVAVSRNYTDVLPNASMRLRFTPELQLRLSAAQTRTRPNFAQLNPSANLGAPPTVCNAAGDPYNCARRGGGGNPFLNPFTSNNYDASLEYYFHTGFASASVFRRDLNGFFQNLETRYIDPTVGPIIINAPVNSGRGRIDGFEAQFQTSFDMESLPGWAHGFGVLANVTYLDAKTGFPNATGGFDKDQIVGVSKWTYNLGAYYERSGLAMRLSYNWRDSFLTTRQNRGNDIYREVARPVGRLDLSASYDVVDQVTVFFDWTNILGKPFRSDLISNRDNVGEATFPRFVRYEETVFSLGVRFRLK